MCRADTTTFDPTSQAPGLARAFVEGTLEQWQLPEEKDSALLLTSELVTNAAVHAGTQIGLSVAVALATLEIAVADQLPRMPRPRYQAGTEPPSARPAWLAENGRGLLIVEALADEWGVAEERAGKNVWFRLAISPQWPHKTSCPCDGPDLHDVVRLPSGRRVQHVGGPWDR